MEISKFKKQSNLNPEIIDAVIYQLGGITDFKVSAPDVASHGASGGFPGFVYYTDTAQFAKRNQAGIMKMAEEMAESLGESGALELIQKFNCLGDEYTQSSIAAAIHGDTEDTPYVLNALAWFALEEVSRSYDDLCSQ